MLIIRSGEGLFTANHISQAISNFDLPNHSIIAQGAAVTLPKISSTYAPTSSLLKQTNMVYTIVVHLRAKPGKENIAKVHAKLNEASAIYSKDKETISWFVMQSVHDPQDFTIVERYENEGSQKYHLENPYWKSFDPFVVPLLEKPMDLRRFEELEPVEGEEALLH